MDFPGRVPGGPSGGRAAPRARLPHNLSGYRLLPAELSFCPRIHLGSERMAGDGLREAAAATRGPPSAHAPHSLPIPRRSSIAM